MMKISHSVTRVSEGGDDCLSHNVTKERAIKMARAAALAYSDSNIYVEWYRSSDGQHGYLNPDGNHVIAGEAY